MSDVGTPENGRKIVVNRIRLRAVWKADYLASVAHAGQPAK